MTDTTYIGEGGGEPIHFGVSPTAWPRYDPRDSFLREATDEARASLELALLADGEKLFPCHLRTRQKLSLASRDRVTRPLQRKNDKVTASRASNKQVVVM
jgi:hypothetical protein